MEEKERAEAVLKDSTAETEKVLNMLRKAQLEDEESNRKGEPSLAKVFLMESVHKQLMNKKAHLELLDSGVLTVLKTWLEPLPDGSLPHDTVKKGVLEILMHMSPEREHLLESGIGKIVFFYQKNPYETRAIKKIAGQLVLKWIDAAREG